MNRRELHLVSTNIESGDQLVRRVDRWDRPSAAAFLAGCPAKTVRQVYVDHREVARRERMAGDVIETNGEWKDEA